MAGDTNIQFTLGVTMDGRVIVDFQEKKIDHLTLSDAEALYLAEGLVDAVREAEKGRAQVLRVNP